MKSVVALPEGGWAKAHREQLFALMEAPNGSFAGDTLAHYLVKDLELAGYATRNPKGTIFSTPKGERALREGLLNGN
jgi:hypothetical protein